MSKRTLFTTVTPLPAGITRDVVLDTLHSHVEMIDLNPLVEERHPIKPPPNATPEEYHCLWYALTDRVQYLPGGLMSGKVSYNACFHDLPDGLQTHCFAPMGLNIRGKWAIGGSLPGEPVAPMELGLGAPLQGLYLREDVDMKCNIVMTSFVKKTLKKAHEALVGRLVVKAQLAGSSLYDHRRSDNSVGLPGYDRISHSSQSSTLVSSPHASNNLYARSLMDEDHSSSPPSTANPNRFPTPSTPPVFSPDHPDFRDKEIEADLCPRPLALRVRRPSQSSCGQNSPTLSAMSDTRHRGSSTISMLNTHGGPANANLRAAKGHQRSHSSNSACMDESSRDRVSWNSLKPFRSSSATPLAPSSARIPPPSYTPHPEMQHGSGPTPPMHSVTSPPLHTPILERSISSHQNFPPQKPSSVDTTFRISIPSGRGSTYSNDFNNHAPRKMLQNGMMEEPDLNLHPALRNGERMQRGHQRSRSTPQSQFQSQSQVQHDNAIGGDAICYGMAVHYPPPSPPERAPERERQMWKEAGGGRSKQVGGLVELEG